MKRQDKKRLIIVFLLTWTAILFLLFFLGLANVEAEEGELALAIESFCQPRTEIEVSEIVTSEWGSDPRFCTSWVKREGEKKEVMSVINRKDNLSRKPDGMIIVIEQNAIKPLLLFQKRARLKTKGGNFFDPANSTEVSYFQLAELIGEDLEKMEIFSFQGENCSLLKEEQFDHSFIVESSLESGYSSRIFHLKRMEGVWVIKAIEYYREGELVSVQIKDQFQIIGNCWRENRRTFLSLNGNRTEIRITQRKFDVSLGDLNREALIEGKPKGDWP